MDRTAGDLVRELKARHVAVELTGDASARIEGMSPLQNPRPGTLVFVEKSVDVERALAGRPAAIVAPVEALRNVVPGQGSALLGLQSVRAALPALFALFDDRPVPPPGVHKTAVVAKSARIGDGASVGPYAVIGDHAVIGAGAMIEAHVTVGERSSVGDGARLFPGVHVYDGVIIGERVRVHSGTVIGSDGYGYVSGREGHRKIPQIGGVRIEDDVEIGANVTIDRGAIGDTVIGRGTKLDNLVHLAHNVELGEHCLIVGQSGVAGSTTVGSWSVLAAQAGIGGHLSVAPQTMIGARAGVTKPVREPGKKLSGFPARDHNEERRIKASLPRLPEMVRGLLRMQESIVRLSRRLRRIEERNIECNTR